MYARLLLLPRAKKIFVVIAAMVLVAGLCSCRRGSNKSAKGDAETMSAGDDSSSEQSKREAQSLLEKGKQLYKNDQDEQAVAALQEAIRLDPNLAEAHLQLGMAYTALERKPEAEDSYKKAIELYRKVVQSNPKEAAAFFNLGQAHSFLHQDEEAARAFRQASRLRSDDEEAYYQLGRAETRLAHYPEAVAAFQKALELDPNDSRVDEALDNAREGAKRVQEGKKHAVEMLKKQKANQNANANGNVNTSTRPTPNP